MPPLPKKRFRFWIKSMIPTILFSALIGTYLDLIIVGMKFYSFPVRPFPDIFPINILFTLAGVPLVVTMFLMIVKIMSGRGKALLIFFCSLFMALMEKWAENFGLFAHGEGWHHGYTFAGWYIFLNLIYAFHFLIMQKP